jgi:hypothetical protein
MITYLLGIVHQLETLSGQRSLSRSYSVQAVVNSSALGGKSPDTGKK